MTAYQEPLKLAHNTGIWIAVSVLYLVSLFVLVNGFSAYIIRTSLNTQNQNNATGIDEIMHRILQHQALEKALTTLENGVHEARGERDAVMSELTALQREISEFNTKTHDKVSQSLNLAIGLALQEPNSQLARTLQRQIQEDRVVPEGSNFLSFLQTRNVMTMLRGHNYSNAENANKAHEYLGEVQVLMDDYSGRQKTFAESLRGPEALQNSLYSKLRWAENKHQRALGDLEQLEKDIEPAHWAMFSSLGGSYGWLLQFVRMPTIAVTLVVTMAAGGLASLVSFTRKFLYMDGRYIGFMRLFSTVGEGIAASIGIFLFAGTGMLMLTQGSSAGPQKVELSPYMVAFIAFLSGFMAESAFARIEDFGKQLFRADPPAKRPDHEDHPRRDDPDHA